MEKNCPWQKKKSDFISLESDQNQLRNVTCCYLLEKNVEQKYI